ncbi:MAG: ribonuclease HII [Candidatus Sungbacteria bacterium]|nr:ribonuclease HII [Candidatus Sungbacteria bacterium]
MKTTQFSFSYLIGIDEAGRGPLAGPVVVAGIKIKGRKQKKNIFPGIRDSKKLSPRQREEWFKFLTENPRLEWAVARVWPKTIDRLNISQAANLGARRVCKRLLVENLALHKVLLDGGLRLAPHIPHQTIIKGDEKVPLIAAASIIAKVTRDRLMVRLHKKFPHYQFQTHKGYATRLHRNLVLQFGSSPMHRQTFIGSLAKR